MEYDGKWSNSKDVPLICLLLLLLVTTIPNSINERRRRRKVLHLEQHLLCLPRSGYDSMMHTKFEQQFKQRTEPAKERKNSEKPKDSERMNNSLIIPGYFSLLFSFPITDWEW